MKILKNLQAERQSRRLPNSFISHGNRRAVPARNEGVALIICLGLLSVMTLLAVTFSISMRIERMASHNFAEGIRAKLLVQTAYVRAMNQIDSHMLGPPAKICPIWDATASPGTVKANILTDDAWDVIPGGYMSNVAQSAESTIRWTNVDINSPTTTGRVAYLIVNTSGMLDINEMGTWRRTWSTNIQEIDITATPDFVTNVSRASIIAERNSFIRYETIDEFEALSSSLVSSQGASNGNSHVATFQTFSYDPAPDQLFFNQSPVPADWWKQGGNWASRIDTNRPPTLLGRREAEKYLGDKFNINSIKDYTNAAWGKPDGYATIPGFLTGYYANLTRILEQAIPATSGGRADDVAWNIINYLDSDRIPQGHSSATPWNKSEGGEPIPMINELVIVPETVGPMTVGGVPYPGGTGYRLCAELWYPYVPLKVTSEDKFKVAIWIWINTPFVGSPPAALQITNSASPYFSSSYDIDNMEFGTPTEFLFFSNSIPIVFRAAAGSPENTTLSTATNFSFLVRVMKQDGNKLTIVDESMGYDPNQQEYGKRRLFRVDAVRGYGVNDPRSNGQVKYWLRNKGGETDPPNVNNGVDYAWDQHTLGRTNSNIVSKNHLGNVPLCGPNGANAANYDGKLSGVPIYIRNNLMRNIGELGHIWQSNLDDEVLANAAGANLAYWRNISLMRSDEGAMLLDSLTVNPARRGTHGLFFANSNVPEAWRAMLRNIKTGYTDEEGLNAPYTVNENQVTLLVSNLVVTNCVSFYDMFNRFESLDSDGGGGNLATAFRRCVPGNQPKLVNDIYREDSFRQICSLLTFRQNIFTMVLAAQVVAPSSSLAEKDWPVISERRAIAQVYRDAYTGRRFIRSFKWLDE